MPYPKVRTLVLALVAISMLTACNLGERLLGSHPAAKCKPTYNDTLYVSLDSLPSAVRVTRCGVEVK